MRVNVQSCGGPPARLLRAVASERTHRGVTQHARHIGVRADASDEQATPTAQAEPATIDIPTRMNNTPHPRDMRRFFYNDAAAAVVRALAAGESRLRVRCTVPELNPEMDVYRVGTLLELVREMATQVAEDGRRVKVCVQGSMGQGVFQGLPLSLSGVSRIMKVMDWGDVADFVTFGEVGAGEVDPETDVYILIAPQNIVGNTIMTNLSDMVGAAEDASKQVVLVNPVLRDIPASGGVMGVRGRAERLAFADSFSTAYHFRLLYVAGSFYPIMGALRYSLGGRWQVYKRVDLGKQKEEYQLWGEWDAEPDGRDITRCFEQRTPLLLRGKVQETPEKKAGWWW